MNNSETENKLTVARGERRVEEYAKKKKKKEGD